MVLAVVVADPLLLIVLGAGALVRGGKISGTFALSAASISATT